MKRSIVQHGSSSLTITLPVKWIQKFKLKKGDELNVEEEGTRLIVSTTAESSLSRKEVSTTDYGIFTKNNLSHLYQLGYDEIEIRFDDSKTLDEIRQRVQDCIGFEIIDQKPNKVYIKSIATTLESEFDTLLRKAFLITNEMAGELVTALEKGDHKKLKEIRSMEALNNKFTDVCIRILNKRGYKTANRTMQMYEIVKCIERIADELKRVCDVLEGENRKLQKEYVQVLKDAVDYYLVFYQMFYKFEPQLKKKIYLERKSLLEKYARLLEKSKGMNSRFVHHAMNIVEKTYEGAGGYFALVL